MTTINVPRTNDTVFANSDLPVEVTGMQAMANKMWLPFLGMGLMIIIAAFIIGLVNSGTAADWFAFSKATREAAATGSTLATQKAFIESTKAWLPAFKFLGIGMLLGGITFLLATILGALRTGGGRVQQALGVEVRIVKPPTTAKVFPMVMMMGMMLLIVALIVAIVNSTLAYGYWNHSVATQLNPALEGSGVLTDLGTITAASTWVAAIKFTGLALMFTGIGLALATIVRVLRWQSSRLWELMPG